MLRINDQIGIDDEYLRVTFVRSRGPGGQNVNKVNTRAQLTFDLRGCPVLAPAVKKRLAQLAGRRLTTQGTLVIQSDRFRRQNRNRTECLDRLRNLIQKALIPPKKRKPTQPTAASRRKRLEDKQRRSRLKFLRQNPPSKINPLIDKISYFFILCIAMYKKRFRMAFHSEPLTLSFLFLSTN